MSSLSTDTVLTVPSSPQGELRAVETSVGDIMSVDPSPSDEMFLCYNHCFEPQEEGGSLGNGIGSAFRGRDTSPPGEVSPPSSPPADKAAVRLFPGRLKSELWAYGYHRQSTGPGPGGKVDALCCLCSAGQISFLPLFKFKFGGKRVGRSRTDDSEGLISSTPESPRLDSNLFCYGCFSMCFWISTAGAVCHEQYWIDGLPVCFVDSRRVSIECAGRSIDQKSGSAAPCKLPLRT